ncbi:hypothetical protein PanWU01x14_095690 [Parasponia andersonii]|uniref:Uncharacterized protein n=1 Tax=Parasponia andersonii TaxID=3476 RepID=A0A2P5D559_PARAD|nr:hypothetical protein PanWU01x14_095690 [Parasponia andersonii]
MITQVRQRVQTDFDSLEVEANQDAPDGDEGSIQRGASKCPSRRVDMLIPKVHLGATFPQRVADAQRWDRIIEKAPSFDKNWLVGGLWVQHDHAEFLFKRVPLGRSQTILTMDTKERHFKNLLTSSMLASVRWHPYLTSNPILRTDNPTLAVHPKVEKSIVDVHEAMTLQLPSSSTTLPQYLPVKDRPRVIDHLAIPESSAMNTPRISPPLVMPTAQLRLGSPLYLKAHFFNSLPRSEQRLVRCPLLNTRALELKACPWLS